MKSDQNKQDPRNTSPFFLKSVSSFIKRISSLAVDDSTNCGVRLAPKTPFPTLICKVSVFMVMYFKLEIVLTQGKCKIAET